MKELAHRIGDGFGPRGNTFHPGLGTELLTFLARALEITIAQWLERGR